MNLNSDTESGSEGEQMATALSPPPIVRCRTRAEVAAADATSDCEKQVLQARAVGIGEDYDAGDPMTVEVASTTEALVMDKRPSAFKPVTPQAQAVGETLLMLNRGGPGKRSQSARDAEVRSSMDVEESYPAFFLKIEGRRHRVGLGVATSPLRPRSVEESAASQLMALERPATQPTPAFEDEGDSMRPITRLSNGIRADPKRTPRVFGRVAPQEDVDYWTEVAKLQKAYEHTIKRMNQHDYHHTSRLSRIEAEQALAMIQEFRKDSAFYKTAEDTLKVTQMIASMAPRKAELESKGMLKPTTPRERGAWNGQSRTWSPHLTPVVIGEKVAPACTSPRDPYHQQQWHQQMQMHLQQQQKIQQLRQQLPPIPNQLPPPVPSEYDGGTAAGLVRTYVEAVAAHVKAKVHVPLPYYKDDRAFQHAIEYGLQYTEDTEYTFDAYMTFMRGRQPSTFKAAIVIALNPQMDPKEACRTCTKGTSHSHKVDAMAWHIRMHRVFTRPILEEAWAKLPNSSSVGDLTSANHAAIIDEATTATTAAAPEEATPAAAAAPAEKLPLPVLGESIEQIDAYLEARAKSWVEPATEKNKITSTIAACNSAFASVSASNQPQQEAQLQAAIEAVQAQMPQKDLGDLGIDVQEVIALVTGETSETKLIKLLKTVRTVEEKPEGTPMRSPPKTIAIDDDCQAVEDAVMRVMKASKAPAAAQKEDLARRAAATHKPEPLSSGTLLPGINPFLMSKDDYATQLEALRAESKRQVEAKAKELAEAEKRRAEKAKAKQVQAPPPTAVPGSAAAPLDVEDEAPERWTLAEDRIILDGYDAHGSDWMRISLQLTNRSADAVKSRHERLLEAAMDKKLDAAPEVVNESDEEIEMVCKTIKARRPDLQKPAQTGGALAAQGAIDRKVFEEKNKRQPFNPNWANPSKVKPRERYDTSGKEIPDPNQDLVEKQHRLSFEQKKLLPKEYLTVILPLYGALSTDLVWVEINDGFTADMGSYTQDNQCFYLRMPEDWPKRKNECHDLRAALPLKNWHLRKCLNEPGVVVEKMQWMYSNYGQSATVVNAAVLRVQYDEAKDEYNCVFLHPITPVHQSRATFKVTWPTDVVKPERDATLTRTNSASLQGVGTEWFNARVEELKKEKVKKDAGIDLLAKDAPAAAAPLPNGWVEAKDKNTGKTYYFAPLVPNTSQWDRPTAPAPPPPAPAPANAPTQAHHVQESALLQEQKRKLDKICAHVLNVASGAFLRSVTDPRLKFPVELKDNRASSCLSKLGAFYVLSVASADANLEQKQRRKIGQLHNELEKCKQLNRWNCETILKAIGALLGKEKEDDLRARCVMPSAKELLGRVNFFRVKKKAYVDGKNAFVMANMNPLDYPLPLAFLEPHWVALAHKHMWM